MTHPRQLKLARWVSMTLLASGIGIVPRLAVGLAKLTHRPRQGIEVSYQAILNRIESRDENWDWRYNVDGLPRKRTFSAVHGLEWTHTLRPTTFYRLNVRQNYFDFKEHVYQDPFDPRYDRFGPALKVDDFEHGAILGGVSQTRVVRNTNAMVFAGSVSHVARRDHQLKAGFEWQPATLYFGTPGYLIWTGNEFVRYFHRPDLGFIGPSEFKPVIGSIYAQDDIEWNDLRFRAGLRYEYFNPRAAVPGDLANPANAISGADVTPPRAATRKLRLLPRLGVEQRHVFGAFRVREELSRQVRLLLPVLDERQPLEPVRCLLEANPTVTGIQPLPESMHAGVPRHGPPLCDRVGHRREPRTCLAEGRGLGDDEDQRRGCNGNLDVR